MNNKKITSFLSPTSVIITGVVFTVFMLHEQGRLWLSKSNMILLWVGDVNSSENSQQIFDPYTFSHILHGVIFFFLFKWLAPRLAMAWCFTFSLLVECGWEVVENSAFIIDRYRSA